MDLEKLSPAPFFFQWQMGGQFNGHKVRNDQGCVGRIYLEDNAEFFVLARNAFDVMMRRGWVPRQNLANKKWLVHEAIVDATPEATMLAFERKGGVVYHADPFTALVEADRWYKENVEGK